MSGQKGYSVAGHEDIAQTGEVYGHLLREGPMSDYRMAIIDALVSTGMPLTSRELEALDRMMLEPGEADDA